MEKEIRGDRGIGSGGQTLGERPVHFTGSVQDPKYSNRSCGLPVVDHVFPNGQTVDACRYLVSPTSNARLPGDREQRLVNLRMNPAGGLKIILSDIQEHFDEVLFCARRDAESGQSDFLCLFGGSLFQQLKRAGFRLTEELRQRLFVVFRALSA